MRNSHRRRRHSSRRCFKPNWTCVRATAPRRRPSRNWQWARQEAAYGTESARIAQLQYKAGVKTIYDVLQAQQAAQSALNDDVVARVNYVDAVVKFRVSLGTYSAQSAVADL